MKVSWVLGNICHFYSWGNRGKGPKNIILPPKAGTTADGLSVSEGERRLAEGV